MVARFSAFEVRLLKIDLFCCLCRGLGPGVDLCCVVVVCVCVWLSALVAASDLPSGGGSGPIMCSWCCLCCCGWCCHQVFRHNRSQGFCAFKTMTFCVAMFNWQGPVVSGGQVDADDVDLVALIWACCCCSNCCCLGVGVCGCLNYCCSQVPSGM